MLEIQSLCFIYWLHCGCIKIIQNLKPKTLTTQFAGSHRPKIAIRGGEDKSYQLEPLTQLGYNTNLIENSNLLSVH